MLKLSFLLASLFLLNACAHSPTAKPAAPSAPAANQREAGEHAIRKMAGCYLVDYSYTESEALKAGYKRDVRVYDVNKSRSVKEWIYTEDIAPGRLRLQHILFATDASGKPVEGSELKHQAEDWDYNAPFRYDFTGPGQWRAVKLPPDADAWTRRVTNLDDGLRYQCTSRWKIETAYPEWTCDNYAPIPGRETRDMSRKDYNTLQRSTRLIVYGGSFLERQTNVKTLDKGGNRTALATELGKNWYVRLPDAECGAMAGFVQQRQPFWDVLRESWDEVFKAQTPFTEKTTKPPRYAKMMEIEEKYLALDLKDPKIRAAAKKEILEAIEAFRLPATNG